MRIARALAAGFAVALVCASGAQAATPELSTNNRLQDRREVAAGQRSYVEGFQDGALLRQRLAHHRRDGRRVGAAAEARRRRLVRRRRPVGRAGDEVLQRLGLHPLRPPRHRRAAGAAHRRRARRQPRGALRAAADQPGGGRQDRHGQGRRPLRADERLPVGLHRRDAQRRATTSPTSGAYTGKALQFTDDGALPGAPEHHYAALVAANQDPASGDAAATGGNYRGPQPGDRLRRRRRRPRRPAQCDDGPFGKGTGGELRYQVTVPAGAAEDPVGRRRGLRQGPRRRAERAGRGAPGSRGRARGQGRLARQARRSGRRSRCPATGCCRTPSTGASRTWPTSRRPPRTCRSAGPTRASSSRPRWGRSPTPAGSAPATPTTRGSSPPTASTRTSPPWRSASSRPPRTTCARCATSPTSSTTARASSSTRRSPTARSGSATTRRRPRPTAPRPTTSTPTRRSSSRAPSRSSGAGPATTASATRCTTSPSATCRSSTSASTSTTTAGPRARATSSGRAWGPRSSTTASTTSARSTTWPTWRAPSTTRATVDVGHEARPQAPAPVRGHVVGHGGPAVRRLAARPRQRAEVPEALDRPGADGGRAHQRRRRPRPASPPTTHGTTALAGRENSCFSGDRPGSLGLFHTGCGGGAGRQGRLRDLLADDLDPGRRRGQLRAPGRRPAAALHRRQRGDDVLRAGDRRHARRAARRDAGDLPVGAQRRPTKGIPPNIDRCWTCRSMVMQAWGNYGTAWSVVHQQLGVRPYLNDGVLQVVPQVPRRPAQRGGVEHPARARVGGRLRVALERGLHDQGRRDAARRSASS